MHTKKTQDRVFFFSMHTKNTCLCFLCFFLCTKKHSLCFLGSSPNFNRRKDDRLLVFSSSRLLVFLSTVISVTALINVTNNNEEKEIHINLAISYTHNLLLIERWICYKILSIFIGQNDVYVGEKMTKSNVLVLNV